MKNTAQQGDVLLKRTTLTTRPETRKTISKNKLVLAEGEVTGHYHGIVSEGSELFEYDGKTYMELTDTAVLTHQEHKHITVEPGIWEIGKVQEYDYFKQMVRPVQD